MNGKTEYLLITNVNCIGYLDGSNRNIDLNKYSKQPQAVPPAGTNGENLLHACAETMAQVPELNHAMLQDFSR